MQAPPAHTGAALTGSGQGMEQPPQWSGLLLLSMQTPPQQLAGAPASDRGQSPATTQEAEQT